MMTEFLNQIEGYADGTISREQFELWFYGLSSDAEATQPEPVVALVHLVEGLLAESSSGGWSEDELRKELNAVVAPYRHVLVA